MKIECISVVIITKNAGAHIRDCLASLQDFNEVIVYDNGSTDDTLSMIKQFANVTCYQGDFMGFGPTKNHAISLASNDWVFSLDADEKMTKSLVLELQQWSTKANADRVGKVLRKNFFMQHPIHYAGWGNDWLVRLFNRKHHQFTPSMVHEKVAINNKSVLYKLAGAIEHQAITEIGQFLRKIDHYSEIRKNTSTKTYSPIIILGRSFFAFFRSYILKRGFLSGWRGLVIAVANANGVFFKYMKIYAEKQCKNQQLNE